MNRSNTLQSTSGSFHSEWTRGNPVDIGNKGDMDSLGFVKQIQVQDDVQSLLLLLL